MNPRSFVHNLRSYVRVEAIEDIIEMLESPPKNPRPEELTRSKWYRGLSSEEKAHLAALFGEVADSVLFKILAILDGVKSISEEQGDFELHFITENGQRTLINSSSDMFLHDIYNSE